MKELSIEEKAKRYDEALERAKEINNEQRAQPFNVMTRVFPELKESEDERVRKALLEMVHDTTGDSLWVYYNVHKEDAIAWLEKQGEQKSIDNLTQQEAMDIAVAKCFEQGEQKPADKVEPKFKVGDIVVVKPMACHGEIIKGKPFEIVDITEDDYISDNGKSYSISLQDGWELIEQKPTWSEEDENRFNNLIYLVENSNEGKGTKEGFVKFINRLKSLRPQNWTKEDKERYISCLQRLNTGNPEQPETINSKWFKEHVYPQNRWRPSDEQMKALAEALSLAKNCGEENAFDLRTLYEQLKK